MVDTENLFAHGPASKENPLRRGAARSGGWASPSQRTTHPHAWRRSPLPRGDSSRFSHPHHIGPHWCASCLLKIVVVVVLVVDPRRVPTSCLHALSHGV